MARLIDVALPLPLFRSFTYSVEGEFANPLVPGSRVVVPFRNRREIGICLGDAEGAVATARTKAILDVPDDFPALDASMLALCRWIAEYYIVPLGMVLRSTLPVLLTGAAPPRPSRAEERRVGNRCGWQC